MSNLIRLTGLWLGQSKKGEQYLAGSLSPSARLLIIPNRDKRQGSKEPDYIAYLAQPEGQEEPEAPATQASFLSQSAQKWEG